MSLTVNQVVVAGHLTREVETKALPSGQSVASFGLALNRRWRDAQGAVQDEVSYLDIEAWGRTAELAAQFLHKGSPCLVTGRLRQNRWNDAQGQARSRILVVADSVQFLAPKGHEANEPVEEQEPDADPAPAANPQRAARAPAPARRATPTTPAQRRPATVAPLSHDSGGY
jgi:single-strand DNA-binding protein